MSAVIIPQIQAPDPRQDLNAYIDRINNNQPLLFTSLEDQEESVILEIRKEAKRLEKHGWQIQCACDAALWKKASIARNGRGNKDIDAIGIMAAISKKSKIIGVTPMTIFNNNRVFRLMQEAENDKSTFSILEVLDEKAYWLIARRAADPIGALKQFAEKKMSLPRFRPSDAARLLVSEGQTRTAVRLKAVENIRESSGQLLAREALLAHIKFAVDLIESQIIPDCPDQSFIDRIWKDVVLTLNDEHQEMFDEDASDALIEAWDQGYRREDEMARKTGLPIADVTRLMNSFDNTFFPIVPRNMSQRSEHQLWHKTGEPFDNAQFMPKV